MLFRRRGWYSSACIRYWSGSLSISLTHVVVLLLCWRYRDALSLLFRLSRSRRKSGVDERAIGHGTIYLSILVVLAVSVVALWSRRCGLVVVSLFCARRSFTHVVGHRCVCRSRAGKMKVLWFERCLKQRKVVVIAVAIRSPK